MDLSDQREQYAKEILRKVTLDENPFEQFADWFQTARESGLPEPNAFSLATADADGAPSVRTVLLKYFDQDGFVFFTNYGSHKAGDIDQNPQVAMCFPWITLERQVIIRGTASKVPAATSLKYFLKRPRNSQLGAWVSDQSQIISSRKILETKLEEIKKKFADRDMTLPPAWGGYRIKPNSFEFWQGGADRLHDRFLYERESSDSKSWSLERLAP
ncbi:MAG: pyridoxamine 5'-phosphate oxidase [Verrucomicrobiota bacterium]